MRILLSSPITPFPSFKGGRDNLHYNYGNATYGQDIFSVPTRVRGYGLHLIAHNIKPPVAVLENPKIRFNPIIESTGTGIDASLTMLRLLRLIHHSG
jgi:hypothetical protein